MSESFAPAVRIDGSHTPDCDCAACKLGRVHREAANYRRRLRVERDNSRALLDRYLAGWLVDVSDFDLRIGLDKVTRPNGALDFELLERELRALLAASPHLAAR